MDGCFAGGRNELVVDERDQPVINLAIAVNTPNVPAEKKGGMVGNQYPYTTSGVRFGQTKVKSLNGIIAILIVCKCVPRR